MVQKDRTKKLTKEEKERLERIRQKYNPNAQGNPLSLKERWEKETEIYKK